MPALKKVIFASSGGAVYGEQEVFPAPESHATATGESLWREQAHRRALFVLLSAGLWPALYRAALRQRLRSAPIDQGEAGVVAIFLSLLLAGKTPVINGDGQQTRDYVYVGDVVAANVAALESPYVGQINIGTGIETDVVTIYEHLREAVGSEIKAQHGPAKTGEQRRSCLDAGQADAISRLAAADGFAPTVCSAPPLIIGTPLADEFGSYSKFFHHRAHRSRQIDVG